MEGSSSGSQSHAQASDVSQAKLVEIKIKTLDSQVYNCNVDPKISVTALKERIATLTGVPTENQRLICRGKVLKDDHTLSDYNVEDGHTLHLVTRQVPQAGGASSAAVGNAGNEEQGANGESSDADRVRRPQISQSVVMGTFNVPDNVEGALSDVNRIITSVIQTWASGNAVPIPGTTAAGRASDLTTSETGQETGAEGVRPAISVNQPAPAERNVVHSTWPTAGPGILPTAGQPFRFLEQAMVIPDALTTITQYLDRLEQVLATNDQQISSSEVGQASSASFRPSASQTVISSRPTPANLGAVIRRTIGLLNGQAGLELNRLSSQLEGESSLTDATLRGELQSAALRNGVLLQHLGAVLLELGRATLTLRVESSAMESAVNSGPAVFISSTGPNPMMVQPVPPQPVSGFGAISAGVQSHPGVIGFGDIPRNVSIHIHANDGAILPGFAVPVQGHAADTTISQVSTASPSGPAAEPASVTRPDTGAVTASGSGVSTAGSTAQGNNTPSVHNIAVPMQVSGPSVVAQQPGVQVVPVRSVVAPVPANLHSRPLMDGGGVHPNMLHPFLARLQHLNGPHGPAPGTTVLPPGSGALQQSATPTVRRYLQVQAWVPDGQGGLRLVTNEEALRTLSNATQAAPASNQQQQPSQTNGTSPQTNVAEEGENSSRNLNDQPAGSQQVPSSAHAGTEGVVAREVSGQADTEVSNQTADVNDQVSDGKKHEEENLRTKTQGVDAESSSTTATTVPAGLGRGGLLPLPRTSMRTGRQHRPSQASCSGQSAKHQDAIIAHEKEGSTSTVREEHDYYVSPSDSSNKKDPSGPFQLQSHGPSRSGSSLNARSMASQSSTSTTSTRAVRQDQGVGLPAGALGTLMGQVMQNPFMRNIIEQVVDQMGEETSDHEETTEQRGEVDNSQGGLDFTRLLQDVMPVVGQAINRVSSTTGSESRNMINIENAQRQASSGVSDLVSNGSNLSAIFQQMMPVVAQALSGSLPRRPERGSSATTNADLRLNEYENVAYSARQFQGESSWRSDQQSAILDGSENADTPTRQEINVEQALEKLEQGSSSEEILRVLAETAGTLMTHVNNEEDNLQLLVHDLCADAELADDYVALLLNDLGSVREENA
ncbi:hypothetical protein KP509_31G026400 [Ceratopteris richardii]|uniref:Ubiquitin-like domain-containing protein n=1 Tax=Ceratopteris richardii TaxID=49495 RepID=A0A8T2QX58_CERRI|nr:hypothetical protein KP509_31G026400 [Ceratopteris richardii]